MSTVGLTLLEFHWPVALLLPAQCKETHINTHLSVTNNDDICCHQKLGCTNCRPVNKPFNLLDYGTHFSLCKIGASLFSCVVHDTEITHAYRFQESETNNQLLGLKTVLA